MRYKTREEKKQMLDWIMFNTVCKRDFKVWFETHKGIKQ